MAYILFGFRSCHFCPTVSCLDERVVHVVVAGYIDDYNCLMFIYIHVIDLFILLITLPFKEIKSGNHTAFAK